MKCKDFSVGDNVLIYRTRGNYTSEDTIVKIGRKYVTTDRGYRFSEDPSYEFSLSNRYEFGETLLLFKNVRSINEHQDKITILHKIRELVAYSKLERCKKVYLVEILELLKKGGQK